MNDFCREIIAKKYPNKLETYLSLDRKLERGKYEVIPSDCPLTPEERELLILLIEELVMRYENKYRTLSYLIEKVGPYVLVVAKEILEKT